MKTCEECLYKKNRELARHCAYCGASLAKELTKEDRVHKEIGRSRIPKISKKTDTKEENLPRGKDGKFRSAKKGKK